MPAVSHQLLKLPPACRCRATDFASELATLCPGGVDVVLNSLTSPGMLAASLSVLKLGGVFIEVGKRDIWAAARVAQVCHLWRLCLSCQCSLAVDDLAEGRIALFARQCHAQERPDVQFHTVAVDFLLPSVIGASMQRISTMLARGARQCCMRCTPASSSMQLALTACKRMQVISRRSPLSPMPSAQLHQHFVSYQRHGTSARLWLPIPATEAAPKQAALRVAGSSAVGRELWAPWQPSGLPQQVPGTLCSSAAQAGQPQGGAALHQQPAQMQPPT